jgi:hypothetical protein
MVAQMQRRYGGGTVAAVTKAVDGKRRKKIRKLALARVGKAARSVAVELAEVEVDLAAAREHVAKAVGAQMARSPGVDGVPVLAPSPSRVEDRVEDRAARAWAAAEQASDPGVAAAYRALAAREAGHG